MQSLIPASRDQRSRYDSQRNNRSAVRGGSPMTQQLEVAFTANLLSDGKLVFKDIGLESLAKDQAVQYRFLEPEATLSPHQLHNLDALICLGPKITAASLSRVDRLIAVARFGVGYDSVDVN